MLVYSNVDLFLILSDRWGHQPFRITLIKFQGLRGFIAEQKSLPGSTYGSYLCPGYGFFVVPGQIDGALLVFYLLARSEHQSLSLSSLSNLQLHLLAAQFFHLRIGKCLLEESDPKCSAPRVFILSQSLSWQFFINMVELFWCFQADFILFFQIL